MKKGVPGTAVRGGEAQDARQKVFGRAAIQGRRRTEKKGALQIFLSAARPF